MTHIANNSMCAPPSTTLGVETKATSRGVGKTKLRATPLPRSGFQSTIGNRKSEMLLARAAQWYLFARGPLAHQEKPRPRARGQRFEEHADGTALARASLVPQCGSLWKSFQLVPDVANPKGSRKLAATVPILVSVTVCELLVVPTPTLPKLSDPGDSCKMILPAPLPVPLSGNLCGLPAALSKMVTAPSLVPGEAGVNVTLIVQDAPGINELGQLLPS